MTNSEHNDLEKLLKDNLSDKTASVPDFVWDRIEEEIFPKKKRRGFFWLFFGIGWMVCAAVAYFFLAGGFGNDKDDSMAQKSQAVEMKRGYGVNSASSKQAVNARVSSKDTSPASARNIGISEYSDMPKSKAVIDSEKQIFKSSRVIKEKLLPGKSAITSSVEAVETFGGKEPAPENGNISTAVQKDTELENPENKNPVSPAHGSVKKDSIAPGNETAAKDSSSAEESASMEKPDTLKPGERTKKFALSVYGSASLYDMAVFKDYLVSGQLSNRSFKSSGFEIGAGFSYRLSPKIGIYTNIAFNQKHTSFDYNFAITESDYFDKVLAGKLIPFETIIDNGVGNCFLTNVKADYTVNSWLLSLGSNYEILHSQKFSIGADLRFSANLNSGLKMNELTALEIPTPDPERFNVLKIGAGLNLDYHFSKNMSIGIAPMYCLQFNSKQSFYATRLKEMVLPASFKFYF